MKGKYSFYRGRRGKYPNLIEFCGIIPNVCRVIVSTGINIDAKYWDEERQEAFGDPNALLINARLIEIKQKVIEAELEATLYNKKFGANEIKRVVKGEKIDFAKTMMLETFREYNYRDSKMQNIKYPSWQKYNAIFNNIQRFLEEEKNVKDILIGHFDYDMLVDMEIWFNDKKYEKVTIAKFHTAIKKFVGKAIAEGLIKDNPYERFKVKRGRSKIREALTEEDIVNLENLDRTQLRKVDKNLEIVLDKFLLSVYTGLRISDNTSLLKKEVKDDPSGLVIDKVTEKMDGVRVVLPLRQMFGGRPEEIVRRYMDMCPDIDTIFPYIPDSKVNIALKTIAYMAKVSLHLTFHVARHTCATLLAEKSGNPFVVMKVLGHRDIKTSMIYIHNSYASIKKNLSEINW